MAGTEIDKRQAGIANERSSVKIEIRRVSFSDDDLKKIQSVALKNAERSGLTLDEWERRRQAGDPLTNDILMVVDPARFRREARDD